MTPKFFLGVGACVNYPIGAFDPNKKGYMTRAGLLTQTHVLQVLPHKDPAAGCLTCASTPNDPECKWFAERVVVVDISKTVDNDWATAQMDGWGVDKDGRPIGNPMETDRGRKNDGDNSYYRLTTIGPHWPLGYYEGRVYLEGGFFKANRDAIDPDHKWGSAYQVHQALTVARAGGKRYAGFTARRKDDGTVEVHQAMPGGAPVPKHTIPFDWNDPDKFDKEIAADALEDIDRTFTMTILTPDSANTVGAVFLNLAYVARLQWTSASMGPKLPFWLL